MFKAKLSLFMILACLSACSSLPRYNPWSNETTLQNAKESQWWAGLNDPAITVLIEAAFKDNPTLGQALARVDEAKAQVGISKADYWPTLKASGNATQDYNGSTNPSHSLTTTVGPSLAWEVDLFGRIRHSTKAAKSRLNARTADAANARLTLSTQVAETVLNLRACRYYVDTLREDLESRTKTLGLLNSKLEAGFSAQTEVDASVRDMENVRTNLALQEEQCSLTLNALVALSGRDKDSIDKLVMPTTGADGMPDIATPPSVSSSIPAMALKEHPSVVASERDAAAAWADIKVARAERLPRLDVTSLLTAQWIRAAGSTLDFATWSAGAGLSGVVFDGGKGARNVSAAEARYHQAASVLQSALRTAVQDAEDALARQQSATDRLDSATKALRAGESTFTATETQWQNGMASLFELEDARRQLTTSRNNYIQARRDRTTAWIALKRAFGGKMMDFLQ